jgi:hypothetical protein
VQNLVKESWPYGLQDYSVWSEEKSLFLILSKTWSANFESSWLKTFSSHKVEASGIFLGSGVGI